MTKKTQQLLVFFLLIFLGVFVYVKYFTSPKKVNNLNSSQINKKSEENLNTTETSNIIKNLKYNVKFSDNSEYNIFAEESEITYVDDVEIVKMKKVKAVFVNKKTSSFTVYSDRAIFNNSTYNTNFEKNIKIEYLDNIIYSEKLDLNFSENIVTIYENVIYESLQGTIKADNVKMNLITKNVEIFMDKSDDKVNILSK